MIRLLLSIVVAITTINLYANEKISEIHPEVGNMRCPGCPVLCDFNFKKHHGKPVNVQDKFNMTAWYSLDQIQAKFHDVMIDGFKIGVAAGSARENCQDDRPGDPFHCNWGVSIKMQDHQARLFTSYTKDPIKVKYRKRGLTIKCYNPRWQI